MDDATRTDDLPGLVARLREARPELADRLPEMTKCGWWQTVFPDDIGGLRALIGDAPARAIVIGVCAEVLAEAGYGMSRWDRTCRWRAMVIRVPGKERKLPSSPDFLTALVSAVIALAKEDRRG